eukprot:gb/GEZN01016053.1/.p2 GENE.gb/GEZN01016053.1/~~gb/GEZN01016053.1/.p2  ORF type:complete len:116 (-),score=12.45 gb/GEZN01016053.1/:517-864(-)
MLPFCAKCFQNHPQKVINKDTRMLSLFSKTLAAKTSPTMVRALGSMVVTKPVTQVNVVQEAPKPCKIWDSWTQMEEEPMPEHHDCPASATWREYDPQSEGGLLGRPHLECPIYQE